MTGSMLLGIYPAASNLGASFTIWGYIDEDTTSSLTGFDTSGARATGTVASGAGATGTGATTATSGESFQAVLGAASGFDTPRFCSN